MERPDDLMRPDVDLGRIQRGWDVYGVDGDKVGTISEVHTDYITVSKGFIFTSERYIPDSAVSEVVDDGVYLNVTKDEIDARGWDQPPTTDTTMGTTTTGMDTDRMTERDEDTTHVPVVEEELQVRKHDEEQGRVRVHKDVTEEEQSINVPLQEEEVHVERHAVSPERDAGPDAFEEQDIEIPIHGEEADVTKEAVVTEEVDINKTQRERDKRVSDTVRRENVRVEKSGDVDVDNDLTDEQMRDRDIDDRGMSPR